MLKLPELDLPMLTKIMGARFRGGDIVQQVALLTQDSELTLEREPSNPYHDNAVRVLLASSEDESSTWLGFLPREVADVVAPHMDAGVSFRVTSLGLGDGSLQLEEAE